MNKTVTGTGKTVEDAINHGLQQLGVTKEQVETNVLQLPDSGLMKIFGKKEAIVEVSLINNPEQRALDFLNDVLDAMKINCKINTRLEDKVLFIDLEGKDMGVLIGRRGQTLDSFQYLVSLVINRQHEEYVRVILDTENYRAKREKTLEDLGEKMANKAVYYQKKMLLEPMNPSERRVIHAKLQNHDKVFTFSEGEEPYRRVVIQLKDKN
ncbi:RNA-binding cell elongation regulator Jag/EloR [Acetobacterium wieringae]|uniref:RNA-binding cell elongation regulator Jag/EloR n=1 Tax=Acetobacterium wieringae TaxID=52694 RepID=UPI0026F2892A|nr:RNA-binding cell elongation regulator Jag/EloR [Acetobacterium wieringae]